VEKPLDSFNKVTVKKPSSRPSEIKTSTEASQFYVPNYKQLVLSLKKGSHTKRSVIKSRKSENRLGDFKEACFSQSKETIKKPDDESRALLMEEINNIERSFCSSRSNVQSK